VSRRALVGLLALMAFVGCGVHTQTSPTLLNDDNVRVVGPAPSATGSPETATDRTELCFFSGDHLVTIVRALPVPVSAHRVLEALGVLARAGLPVGIRTAIHGGDFAAADGVVAARGIARVGLSADFVQRSSSDQVLALAQIVCTLTNLPGVGQVRFTLHGERVEIPRADGSLTGQPVSRYDYRAFLPAS
jgi:hypothetical protein